MKPSLYGLWKKMYGKAYNLRTAGSGAPGSHFPVTVLAVTEDEATSETVIAYKPMIHDGLHSCTYKRFIERFVEMPPSKHALFLEHLEKCTFCRCEPKGDLNGLRLLCEPGAALFKAFADSIVSRPATAEDFLAMVRDGKGES